MKRTLWLILALTVLFCLISAAALADLTLPSDTTVIEEEAFMNTSLGNVTLNEGLKRIESRAFAGCEIWNINLPASLEFIADDALDWDYYGVGVSAVENTYAWKWATDHHFIIPVETEPLGTDIYQVSWEPAKDIGTYYIFVFADEYGQNLYQWAAVDSVSSARFFTDIGIPYYFEVAYFFDGVFLRSGLFSSDRYEPMQAPANPGIQLLDQNTIRFSWDPVPFAEGYRIYYSDTPDWDESLPYFTSLDGIWQIDPNDPYYDFYIDNDEMLYVWVCTDNGNGRNYCASAVIDGHFAQFANSHASFEYDRYTLSTAGCIDINYNFESDLEGVQCGIDCDFSTVFWSYQNMSPYRLRYTDLNLPVGYHLLNLWFRAPDGTKWYADAAPLIIEQGPDCFISVDVYPSEIYVPINSSADFAYSVFSTGCPIECMYFYNSADDEYNGIMYKRDNKYIGTFTVPGSLFPATGTYTLDVRVLLENGLQESLILTVHVTDETVCDITCDAWLTDTYIISWTPLNGIDSYTLYTYQDEACTRLFGKPILSDSEPCCYINTDPGKPYYFVIEWERDGKLYRSAPVTTEPRTPLSAPDNISGYVDGSGTLRLTWDEVAGAASYRVWHSDDQEWSTETPYDTAEDGLHYEITCLCEGIPCYVWLSANEEEWYNNGCRSSRLDFTYVPDPVVLETPVLVPPNLLQAVWDEDSASIRVYWDAVEGAQGYRVFACTEWTGGEPDPAADIVSINISDGHQTDASIPLSMLSRGAFYYVTVSAYANSYETSPYSNKKLLAVPEQSQEKEHVLILGTTKWKPDFKESSRTITVECDSEYIVSIDISCRDWLSYETHGDQLTLKAAKNTTGASRTGTVYVRCDEHARTDSITVKQSYGIDLDAPVVTSFGVEAENGISWLVARWSSVPNAEQYEIQFSDNGSNWGTVSKNGAYDREYRNMYYETSRYYIRVRANNGFDHSDWSEVKYMDSTYVGVNSIEIDDPGTVYVGDEIDLDVTFSPKKPTVKLVRWEIVSGSEYAYITDGVLYAVKAGTVTIKAASAAEPSKTDSLTLIIRTPVSTYTPVERILISGIQNLYEGEEWLFSKSVSPAAAKQEVLWSVENGTGTAYIDPTSGMFRALTAGTVYVKASATDASGQCSLPITVTISKAAVPTDQVVITGESMVLTDSQITLSAAVYPTDAFDRSVTWTIESDVTANSNSFPTVSIYADGNRCVVTGIAAGTAVITAASADGIRKSKTITVTASIPQSSDIAIQSAAYNDQIIDKRISLPSGSTAFTVSASGAAETIRVQLDGVFLNNVGITDLGGGTYAVSGIPLSSGVHLISFRTSSASTGKEYHLAVYDPVNETPRYVTMDGAAVKKWPAADGETVTSLALNDVVRLYGAMEGYVYIHDGHEYGWMQDSLVDPEHTHQFTRMDKKVNQKYAYYDQDHHYLCEYEEVVYCSVCNEKGENILREISREEHGELLSHHWNGNICTDCLCDQDGLYTPVNLALHMDSQTWLTGNNYPVSVTWESDSLSAQDLNLVWFAFKEADLDDYLDSHDNKVEYFISVHYAIDLVSTQEYSSDATQCIFRALQEGNCYIGVQSNTFPNCFTFDAVRITVSAPDEVSYYQALRSLPVGVNPMDCPTIFNTVYNEIRQCYGDDGTAETLTNYIRHAPKTYRDLYLWSFFDYTKRYDKSVDIGNHYGGRIVVNDKRADQWFHESGHAIDYNLTLDYISISPGGWRDPLYNAIYNRIYGIVYSKVWEAVTELKYYKLDSPMYMPMSKVDEVVDAIMGPKYKFRSANPFEIITYPWVDKIPFLDKDVYGKEYGENQEKVFYTAVHKLWDTVNRDNSKNSVFMYNDMLAGCTNQVGSNKVGHGPLSSEKQKYYWFKKDSGLPTYWQNMDAWAEYFSSMMLGLFDHNLNPNLTDFPEACSIMDQMAEELLEGYRNKHQ